MVAAASLPDDHLTLLSISFLFFPLPANHRACHCRRPRDSSLTASWQYKFAFLSHSPLCDSFFSFCISSGSGDPQKENNNNQCWRPWFLSSNQVSFLYSVSYFRSTENSIPLVCDNSAESTYSSSVLLLPLPNLSHSSIAESSLSLVSLCPTRVLVFRLPFPLYAFYWRGFLHLRSLLILTQSSQWRRRLPRLPPFRRRRSLNCRRRQMESPLPMLSQGMYSLSLYCQSVGIIH